ncbi:MAG: NADH-quinone oxidoreductase subunit NuoG [Pseudomonadota bacterium]
MPTIEIDGQKFDVENGKTIIQVADEHGIHIPRFCYHHKLSVAANCRMCLVEVEGGRKPAPACATPVMDGMKVFTKSKATRHSQKAVMEFLLINHPLDCPICDQGGQCELQDLTMGFGYDASKYNQVKTSVADKDIGPLIATEMTRCIKCTRCVRFGDEIAGLRELGAIGRGENTEISTYIERFMQSEVSGNIIDLCPVGALLSKPFLYRARAWEVNETPGIAAHDCLGSNLYHHSRRGELMRVVPRHNEAINENWLSDRDRFSYTGIYHQQRLLKPMMKIHGDWREVSWEEALTHTAEQLRAVVDQHGAEQLAALASPSATTEELYLLQKLWRALGSNNIDHRLRQTDVSDQAELPLYLGMENKLADIENQQAIMLIGSNIRHEQPLAAVRVRKAWQKGCEVMAINLLDHDFNFELTDKVISSPDEFITQLAQLAKALVVKTTKIDNDIAEALKAVIPGTQMQIMAEHLRQAEKSMVVLGAFAYQHKQAAIVRKLAKIIADLSGSQIVFLSNGANSVGAHIAGAVPHRQACGQAVVNSGMSAADMLKQPLKAYLTLAVEPELDSTIPTALTSLEQADFVVCLSAYQTDTMSNYADVILPIAPFAETSGTFVNVEGQWQSFKASIPPQGDARPAWKVLRVLANLLSLPAFDYTSSNDVRDELRQYYDAMTISFDFNTAITANDVSKPAKSNDLELITQIPIYATDSIVRRATPLQQVFDDNALTPIRVHSATLKKANIDDGEQVNLRCGDNVLQLPVLADKRVPQNCVLLNIGMTVETAEFAESDKTNKVSIEKII